MDVHGFHGFLDFVLLALLDEVGVDGLFYFGVAFEFEVGDHFVGVFVDVLLDFAFFSADGGFAGFSGADGGFGYGLVLEEFHLGGVEAGGAGVNDGADFIRELSLKLGELLLGYNDARMAFRVSLAQSGEVDFFGDDLAADALDVAVVINIVGFGACFLLTEFVRGDVVLGLG